jgi:hypothetical protein
MKTPPQASLTLFPFMSMSKVSVVVPCLAGILLALGSSPVSAVTVPTGQIQGSIYADDNNNGGYDPGENVADSVVLLKLVDGKWTPFTLVSGASYTINITNGQFVFQNLPLGSYRVQLVFPDGSKRTSQNLEVSIEAPFVDLGISVTRSNSGAIVLPDSYGLSTSASGGTPTGGTQERRSFVNISTIIGPEMSVFKP